ncbi:hypothetical protein [Actinospongicola halichondriae]|uniref:hypothetical protein n=1 Tax=Actinospongicola halichondriae TaxID=3236844 RepID=UPI003D4C10C4
MPSTRIRLARATRARWSTATEPDAEIVRVSAGFAEPMTGSHATPSTTNSPGAMVKVCT